MSTFASSLYILSAVVLGLVPSALVVSSPRAAHTTTTMKDPRFFLFPFLVLCFIVLYLSTSFSNLFVVFAEALFLDPPPADHKMMDFVTQHGVTSSCDFPGDARVRFDEASTIAGMWRWTDVRLKSFLQILIVSSGKFAVLGSAKALLRIALGACCLRRFRGYNAVMVLPVFVSEICPASSGLWRDIFVGETFATMRDMTRWTAATTTAPVDLVRSSRKTRQRAKTALVESRRVQVAQVAIRPAAVGCHA